MLSNVEVPGKLLDWLDLPYSCTKGVTLSVSTKHTNLTVAHALHMLYLMCETKACVVRCCEAFPGCAVQPT